MIIKFPTYAEFCLETIEKHGFEAWFVGGCVRDSILSREFSDIDITTNARPEQIEAMFERTVPTGKKHGTVTVLIGSNPIEVTTYRSESLYLDNRHPESVTFENNIESDLARRDFTINAFAYHNKRGLLDLFSGIHDLENGIIRAVGEAKDRFTEDALRILRAYRFASVLGFALDKTAVDASYLCGELLSNLSGERVLTELRKLSYGQNPSIIVDFVNKGFLTPFGISKFNGDVSKITSLKEKYRTASLISLTEHDTETIKLKLKPDNRLIENIKIMDTIRSLPIPENKIKLKLLLNRLGVNHTELYTEYIKVLFPESQSKELTAFAEEILNNAEPFCIEHLKISGDDLKNRGVIGKDIKIALSKLTLAVIEDPELNSRSALLSYLNKIM